MAADYLRFSHALVAVTETSQSTYATDTNDVPSLNAGISSTAKHLTISQSLLEDEARAWDEGVLEDFKKQRDTLVSVRDMFDRRDRYAKDNIPQLERRIETNENKLAGLMGRPEGTAAKPGEQEKLEQAVRAVCNMICSLRPALTLLRTSSQSWINMLEESSLKSASGMNWVFFSSPSIMLAGCIRIGAKNV